MSLDKTVLSTSSRRLIYSWLLHLGNCRIHTEAAAMSFISLLALVPALTLIVWFIAKLPRAIADIEQVKNVLLELIVPESASAISETLKSLLDSASSVPLVSLPLLLVSIFGLMINLEKSFNNIFEAPHRSLFSRVRYIIVTLIVGPLLLSLTLASTQLLPALGFIGWLDASIYLVLLPKFIEVTTVTLMYRLVPSDPPSWRLSIIAGVTLTILLEILRQLMQIILVELGSYEILYGIFAAVPLFLVWIYSLWLAVFALAVLLHCLDHRSESLQRTDYN